MVGPLIPFTREQLKSLYKCSKKEETSFLSTLIYKIYNSVIEHAKKYEDTYYEYIFYHLTTKNGKLIESNHKIIITQLKCYFIDCDITYCKKPNSDIHFVRIDWE